MAPAPRRTSERPIASARPLPRFGLHVRWRPHNSEVARGSTASAGAREAALLSLLRADVRVAARARDGGDSQPRGAEVRVPQLLLPPHDSRWLLRRPAVRRDGRRVRGRAGVLLAGRAGARHAAGAVRRRAARARPLGRGPYSYPPPPGRGRPAGGSAAGPGG